MCRIMRTLLLATFALTVARSSIAQEPWPPQLKGVTEAVKLQSKQFLQIPAAPPEQGKKTIETERQSAYVMATHVPKVELAFHKRLGEGAISRRLWSSWGDIGVASDGTVYCAIGDHGDAEGGDARAFLYRWLPQQAKLEQIVDFNKIAPRKKGQPAWSKVHAKIDEGPDGKIYISCTLNDGNRASRDTYQWSDEFPGGQLYQYDPSTKRAALFASLPPKRCTATSLIDRQRGIWWCNLEAGQGNALWGLDLKTKKPVCQTKDGAVVFNRAFALLADGSLLLNGSEKLMRLDPSSCNITMTKTSFADSPGMRCASRQSKKGFVYGVTHRTNQLFRYDVKRDRIKMLGPAWATRGYTTVIVLSPDERFLYYLPGAHGQGWRFGTPVVQFDIASGKRKVLAFLATAMEKEISYVPAGTYGMKLSPGGDTLYVNFNGHAADSVRPEKMKPIGFGLCAFAAIHIPAEER